MMPMNRFPRTYACPPRRTALAILLSAAVLGVSAPSTLAVTPPSTQPPDAHFVVNQALGTVRVPVRVTWPPAVAGDRKVARYQLHHRSDAGTWTSVKLSSALARSVTVKLRPGTLNRFRVRAVDSAGLAGKWAVAQPLWLALTDDRSLDIGWSGNWLRRLTTSAYGGTLHWADAATASATWRFTATQVAWVAPRGPKRGRAHVSIGGGPITTVDLKRSTSQARRIVFTQRWNESTERSLNIAVEGTVDRPRVDVDAFVTLGPAPTAVLVGAGDIATCARTNDEATADVVASVPGTIFTTGDNVYPAGTPDEFANCYHPSWGRFRERTRPSPGNHDYQDTATADGYFGYFGKRAGTKGKGWYAYDVGTWRAYALNSNCVEVGGCTSTSAQYAWLKRDLAANPRRCVVAYWHHPRYSSGYHGSSSRMRDIQALLYDMGAELVLAGHDHSYERFAPMTPSGVLDPERGIRNFVVGTGGGSLYAPGEDVAPNTEVLNTDTYGVLKLTLDWSRYAWEFMPAAGGKFTDAGTGTCH